MRYATTPRWVFVMLIVMGLGFMGGAFAFLNWVPPPAGVIVGAVWLVMGAGMAFFSYRAIRHAGGEDRIRHEGTPATATLLSAKTTGWLINGVPQWVLRVRIDGYGAPYETKLTLMTYTPPADGATLGVRVDPLRKDHVVLSGDDAPASAATGAAAPPELKESILAALRQSGIDVEGGSTVTTVTMPADATRHAADTVKLLDDLDRMRANGALGQDEFDELKKRLLGEDA